MNGTHSKSTVKGLFGLGENQNHKTIFSFDADHSEILASEDIGATPVEYVLVGRPNGFAHRDHTMRRRGPAFIGSR